MSLGPFLFGSPLALLGVIALPIIWFILRATPPTPKEAELPSLRLLDEIDPREETPAKTPWWVLLLRFTAAAAAIVGLALPIYAPGAQTGSNASGPVLVIVDNGWSSAERWSEIRSAAAGALDGEARDTAAHLLLTAPKTLNADPSDRYTRNQFEARVRSLDPQPWPIDRNDALERLEQSGLRPGRILWLSNGLRPETARPFAEALGQIAPLTIYAAPPRGPSNIAGLTADASGVRVRLHRPTTAGAGSHFVSALTLDGSALATAEATFDAGERTANAEFKLPPAALSRISRFQVTGASSAGNVWLWDSADRSRRVGLVSGDTIAQPLLSDMHYIRKALEPFATISESNLPRLIEEDPDAIILTDIGQIAPDAREDLIKWVEQGGALIRFAGPRMAAQRDDLVPAPLRRSSRAIGGALTWEEPQPLGEFPDTSPFAGLTPPDGIKVRQQVLARPGPNLARRTWARLADGSPLVTADQRGNGMLVLFHVTAGPDWSDLPYSGVFVDMLRRAIAAGQGEAVADEEGLYTPALVLNGFGRLEQPGAAATPLQATDFATQLPNETHPPGLYQGPAGSRALNIGAFDQPVAATSWPAGARLLGDAEARTQRLGGLLLGLAAILLAIDLIVALALAGRLPVLRSGTSMITLLALSLIALTPHSAEAQARFSFEPFDERELDKASQAALNMRLAYIETGDAEADRTTAAGLYGLSTFLNDRSSVEPYEPHAVSLETDALHVYPILFLSLPDNAQPLSGLAISRMNEYMRQGGALFVDTRRGDTIGTSNSFEGLEDILSGLDTPPLTPVPDDHVLTRSFYLLDGFPGRYANRRLWIEATGGTDASERRGDGVSRLIIGDADYLAAWAIDERRRPLFTVDGGDEQREMARRFGINLVVYVLTGNYKEDQVHIPALLERLNPEDDTDFDPDADVIP